VAAVVEAEVQGKVERAVARVEAVAQEMAVNQHLTLLVVEEEERAVMALTAVEAAKVETAEVE
jgi:hypothetical protein